LEDVYLVLQNLGKNDPLLKEFFGVYGIKKMNMASLQRRSRACFNSRLGDHQVEEMPN
jgi:hypothetical protein